MVRLFEMTKKQEAALDVVLSESKAKGKCALSYEQISRAAGVSRNTVRKAIEVAEEAGLISVQGRPMQGETNIINVLQAAEVELSVRRAEQSIERGVRPAGRRFRL